MEKEPVIAESIKSADRALDLLEAVAAHPGGLTFTEVVDTLGWPRSSTHGLLATLTRRGFLVLDEPSRRYAVGVRAWEVGRSFLGGEDLATLARPAMQALRDDLNETVQLAVLDGRENVYVAKVDSSHPLALVSRVGARLPAHVTGVGKMMLSALPDDAVEALFEEVELRAYTPQSITDVRSLVAELRAIRDRGYSMDRGEFTRGVFCVAFPVRDSGGTTVAAVSVTVPDARVTDDLIERMRIGSQGCVEKISARLGWSGSA